ncbi:MAG TPA: hypothetical protein VIL46_19010, partial [Gemmataceae bacterium]
MSWPLSQDYNEALQDPGTAFADAELRRGEVVSNALGLPAPRSGNFADVYQVRCPGGAAWAVKCFTREVPGLRERYAHIDAHLRKANLPFSVGFRFLEQGVRVRGRWYPLLKMQWVEGLTLNEFLRDYRGQAPLLDALAQIWVRMARRLREARVAHGDLQHGNVLLVPGGKPSSLGVRLIDYDGMYVPALADRPSGEVGHPAYQHPARLREKAYGPDVDCFPHLVIYTALRALRAGAPSLWQRYDTGDNLLFRARDFAEPGASPLLKELWLSPDEELHHLAGHLVLGCQRELGRIAWLDALVIDGETTPLTQRQQRHVAETLGVAAPAAVTVAAAPPGAAAAPDPWADIDAAAPPPAGKPPRRHREQPAE